jgi:hypothetical protein
MASIKRRDNGKYPRAVPRRGRQGACAPLARKVDVQAWLDEQTAKMVTGTHVAPKMARTTVGEWCDVWLDGYRGNRASTVS